MHEDWEDEEIDDELYDEDDEMDEDFTHPSPQRYYDDDDYDDGSSEYDYDDDYGEEY